MKKIKCIAVDFDGTLANFNGGISNGFHEIFSKRGIAKETVDATRKEIDEKIGFTIEKFVELIKEKSGIKNLPAEESIVSEFRSRLRFFKAYTETTSSVEEWLRFVPVVVVTRGNPAYQKEKLDLVNVPANEIFIVEPPQKKSEVLRKLVERYGGPIIFVDDRVSELDDVRRNGLGKKDVITLRMKRSDTIETNKSEYEHKEINSLESVSFYLYEPVVRKAEEKDIPEIARINSMVFLGNRDNQAAAEEWASALFRSFPIYQYFVAEVRGKIAGYIGWQIHGGFLRPEPVIELEQIGVDPRLQGLEIGPELEDTVFNVIEWVKSKNSRIESNIFVFVWGYSLNFNALKIYAEKFNEGVKGLRIVYGERPENMLRWRIPLIKPVRNE